MEINHFSHEHPLVLSEENFNENFPCSICCEPIFGLSYCCIVCRYTLHQWCAELPRELSYHKLHPIHHFILYNSTPKEPSNPSFCYACNQQYYGFIYKCIGTNSDDDCPFNLHIHCALFPDDVTFDISGDNLIPNPYIGGISLPKTPCVVCQYKVIGPAFTTVNQRYYHFQCVEFPREVKHEVHRHNLSLRPPLIEDDWYTEFYCDACEKERNPNSYVYYCEPCELVAHIGCGISGSERPAQDVIGNFPAYNLSPLTEEMPKTEINLPKYEFGSTEEAEKIEEADLITEVPHFQHEHPIILVNFPRPIREYCKVCESHILGLTYYCKNAEECDFYIHKRCAELPKQIHHYMHHDHGPLRQLPPDDFWCQFCGEERDSLRFGCTECDFVLCASCALLPENLSHPSHEHVLTPAIITPWGDSENDFDSQSKMKLSIKVRRTPFCKACGYLCDDVSLICESCDFNLHVFCSLLPLSGKHETHKHDLVLTYTYKEDPNALEFICDTCEKPRIPNRWVYCCPDPKCYVLSHVDCVAPDVFAASKF